jgi:triosephosphate isomerase (TIM)
MNKTAAEAAGCIEAFIRIVAVRSDVDIVVCPPYLSLYKARELLRNSHVKVGAQDVFWQESGAFTGKVSAPMLYDAGVSFCIVGHSETRGRFGKVEVPESTLGFFSETDETVNLKIKALLYHSIVPILCVGETEAERNAGRTDEVIASQLKGALDGLVPEELYGFVVAYEPVWAIGTGNTCDAAEAERVCAMIRSEVGATTDAEIADQIRVLYGGSVKASNAKELFSQPNIDGGLVGGASLDPQEFCQIVKSA